MLALIARFSPTWLTPVPRVMAADLAPIIAYLAAALVLIVLLCLFRKRFLKIVCACGAEICLFLASKIFFGDDAIITIVLQWFTAAVACIMTVAIVNRINWGNMRGRPSSVKAKASPPPAKADDRSTDSTQA